MLVSRTRHQCIATGLCELLLLVQVSDETRHMMRHDDKHSGITNITHNDGVDRWLVVRRKLTKAREVLSIKQLAKATTNHKNKRFRYFYLLSIS